MMNDLISRQAAIDEIKALYEWHDTVTEDRTIDHLKRLPSAQPMLYGYDIEHLKLIANVMQKENLPPERVTEALMDIGRIVAIVRDEFEETLRKAVEQCTMT